MAGSDRQRWDSRHAAVSVGEPMPPSALLGRADVLPSPGRALDVACGRGAVAVWLALRGFVVDAVDVSATGLAGGAELAERHGVGERIRWVRADLDGGLPAGRDPDGGYDVVVCQRFREPALYPPLAAALRPGGLLAVTVLSEVGDEGGRFRAAPGELLAAFGDLDVLDHVEGDGEASLLARRTP
ncbi:MAG: methyltransferase domain-containing protein [Pseudonocardia sp.]|nr:methyltransferase domain-containing protein [Pseudonocardia sp.]